MIIGFDFQPLVQRGSGGEVQWLKGLVRAYAEQYPDDRILLFDPTDFSLGLPPSRSIERIAGERGQLHELQTEILRARSADVLIRTYPTMTHPVFPMERQIVIVPDMQFFERPEWTVPEAQRHRHLGFGRLLSQAGAVATMTEFSRESVMRYPWTRCEDIFLMPPAVDRDLVELSSSCSGEEATWQKEIRDFSGFFFMPGNSWPHKNHRRLFDAFASALPRLPKGMGLVLTGTGGEWPEILAGTKHLPIRHLGYVSRSDIAQLYQRARALVFFSCYEGFGMPLLEAFHFGLPVACSNVAALAEVGKDAVLNCDPEDVPAMSDRMVRIATDEATRRGLVERGKERLTHYSWESSARALHEGARRVVDRARSPRPIVVDGSADNRITVIVDADFGGPVAATVKSVLDQSYPNWELLISSTHPLPASGSPQDSRIRFVVEDDPNAAGRANRALSLATGNVRMYIRPDMILEKTALETIATRLREEPASDVIVCAAAREGYQGNNLESWSLPVSLPESIDVRSLWTYTFEHHLVANLVCDIRIIRPLVAWRRRIESFEPRFEQKFPHAFDLEFWLRLAGVGANLALVEESLATIVVDDNPGAARLWYGVMRDCQRIALSRQTKSDKRFYRLLNHRRWGLEPAVERQWRKLPSALGRCDYLFDRARQRWTTVRSNRRS